MARQGEKREATFEVVHNYWENEAKELGENPTVTIRDHCFRMHELHILSSIIPRSTSLLDVGCGTGFGTLLLAQKASKTVGFDYSQEMINFANRLLTDTDYRDYVSSYYAFNFNFADPTGVEFKQENILNFNLGEKFDCITGQRILINLQSHDDQMKALSELRKHAKDDTVLYLVEATKQGHEFTDKIRTEFGLPILEKYWHNLYVDESRYNEWTNYGWEVTNALSFDTYLFLSKIVYPSACGIDNIQFLSGANMGAFEVASLFRTYSAVQEIGLDDFFEMYYNCVKNYNTDEAEQILSWYKDNKDKIKDWSCLGHQRLIICKAV